MGTYFQVGYDFAYYYNAMPNHSYEKTCLTQGQNKLAKYL